ncbi:DUF2206 domain-containing protein [Streptomyces yangpuensis]|uniref:DUF2206 domain-containing protein n=1 Tax=Streptomyces yangpuensis TaxID=1648182 RepID=A0ABY5Q3S6_9ACTN|nr:DUF2206 domain-containing protein [Streptomyces yangpuensis]UUY50929.1 DUF2206 domain-containing protein [Streptomyces yangpuensis]
MKAPTWLRGRLGVLLSLGPACAVETLPGVPALLLAPVGLWLLFAAPVLLLRGFTDKVVSTRSGSLLLAAGLAVLLDVLVALGVNTVLPPLGVERPLTRLVLASATTLVLLVLGILAPQSPRPLLRGAPLSGARPVAWVAGVALLLSVAGPIRLNNGLGGAVSTAALVVVTALIVLLLLRHGRCSPIVLEAGIYAASATLLLLTSLRGWYITGHDIQREYLYFRLTLGGGFWDISAYTDPYNACLSITLLPVSIFRLTGIEDIYVFKAVLPLLFALTPVLVHRAVRNVASPLVALLSAVFFMAFPTFFTDMPFLGRQAIAFLLLACAMLVLTDSRRPLPLRRAVFTVLLAGVVLSHYSTIYVIVGTLATAFAVDKVWRLASRPGRARAHRAVGKGRTRTFLTWWTVAVPAVLALLWAGPLTHTGGQLESTLRVVASDLFGSGDARGGSSDTRYSLFGGAGVTPEARLAEYREDTIGYTGADRAEGKYLPLDALAKYPTPVAEKENLPLTPVGRALDTAGLSVPALNGVLRQAAALLLQVLVLVGFVIALRGRGSPFTPVRDQITLTVGALAMMGLFTLVPQLSVDYSVLRAFQQGLLFFAPFIAAGALWAVRRAGRRALPVLCVLVAGLLLDLTGAVPKALGGYPAQLALSNSGPAYDIYYPHAEDRRAAMWLNQRAAGDDLVVQTDRYSFSRLQTLFTVRTQDSVHPTLLRSQSYVLLGSTPTRKDEVTVFFRGDLVTYRYPRNLLDTTRNLIYSNEGAVVYR